MGVPPIEKMVGREFETNRKKKKEQTKTEHGIVRRLARNGLIDKDKVGDIFKKHQEEIFKKKKKKKKRLVLRFLGFQGFY